jgi:lysophospholipase L1-like esterase
MSEMNRLKLYRLDEIKNLKVHGRNTGSLSPLTLFWTGSALELNVSGSELWIEVEASYDSLEPWINIVINSCPVSRRMVTKGRSFIPVFRGMNPEKVKNIRIIRDTQAMNGDPECCLQLHAIRSDGDFLPIKERPYRLEFIGDSISSGEGAVGAREEEDWIPMWFSATDNYTWLVAQALDADYRVISESGWGVYSGWDNNPHFNMPAYYEQVCGVLTGERNRLLGAFVENDFAAWQPDAVIVNLGTNDGNAFYSPAWKDEVTGRIYKQGLNEDGSFQEEALEKFRQAVKGFLYKIRYYNPKAQVVWAYGMLGQSMLPAIQEAVEAYIKESKDPKVSVLELPDTTRETVGSRMHPGVLSHRRAAEVLTEYLKSILISEGKNGQK